MTQKTYEAMFIVDPLVASKEWNRVTEEIEKVVKRYKGEVVSLKKWGERKLTYPVKKQARGTYVLAFFKGPSDMIAPVRNDFQLSEIVLRFMILLHEGEVKEQEAPKDFETIGLRPSAYEDRGGGGERSPRPRAAPAEDR